MKKQIVLPLFWLLLSIALLSCSALKYAESSQESNKRMQDLTIALVEKSNQSYTNNALQVTILKDSFNAVINTEKLRGKWNLPTVNMWTQMNGLVTDFENAWKAQNTFSPVFIDEYKQRVNKLFDYIINLEENIIMPQTIIKDILTDATSQIAVLAESTVSKYKKQAVADGKKIVTNMKNDLTRWVSMLEDRKLTTAEFELLVKSYKTQIVMNGLLLAGLSEIRAAEFGLGVLNIVTDVALTLVEKAAGKLLSPSI